MTLAYVIEAFKSFFQGNGRRVRTETHNFILGGEGWPGAVAVPARIRR